LCELPLGRRLLLAPTSDLAGIVTHAEAIPDNMSSGFDSDSDDAFLAPWDRSGGDGDAGVDARAAGNDKPGGDDRAAAAPPHGRSHDSVDDDDQEGDDGHHGHDRSRSSSLDYNSSSDDSDSGDEAAEPAVWPVGTAEALADAFEHAYEAIAPGLATACDAPSLRALTFCEPERFAASLASLQGTW
jgi:hypothetical protein